MKYLPFTLILLFFACDPTDIGGEQPEPEPFTCNFGFITNTVDETCSCPDDHVTLGTLECRRLQTGEYYATMEGCFVDLGMIVKFEDTTEVYSNRRSARPYYLEDPDTAIWKSTYEQTDWTFKDWAIITTLDDGTDSIYWDISPEEYKRVYQNNEYAYLPWFEGRIIDADTIRGRVRWGPGGEERKPVAELDCPVTFVRQQ
jgi:hypothetical protein